MILLRGERVIIVSVLSTSTDTPFVLAALHFVGAAHFFDAWMKGLTFVVFLHQQLSFALVVCSIVWREVRVRTNFMATRAMAHSSNESSALAASLCN